MVYGEILAGGNGARMGNTEMPKQYLMLGKKPIIIHTLEQFILNSKINRVIICCPKDWVAYTKEIVMKYIKDSSKIEIAVGGNTRNETIINGCKFIEDKYGLKDEDVIITHDAVRPFITQRIIEDNIEAVKKYSAVDTAIAAFDTIIESKDGEIISNIPIRSEMYQGQTPQSFNIKKLVNLYNSLTEQEKEILTDACKIFVIKGEKVKIINGEVYNIKITTLHDLKLSNAILTERDKND